ncbi:MAG: LutC/YkgG family protein [Acidimicrobiales bacterium]
MGPSAVTGARDEVLSRIRRAVATDPPAPAAPRSYRGAHGAGDVQLFARRIADYGATVHTVDAASTAATLGEILGARSVVVPPGFPQRWGLSGVADEPALTPGQLDAVDGVVTTCAVGIAETGTIVLDHGAGQGRRALTLVPDYHLVVVHARQVLAGVPDAIAALRPAVGAGRPLTWISGPSATSDIELDRVEGVHGPRTLEVVVVVG